jgi:hypothetical protein
LAAIEFARHRGATTIWAGVTIGNVRSENVLNRLGFNAVKEMGSYVRYRLTLTPASIFHITSQREWDAAREAREYRGSTRGVTLEEQGFIHCSSAEQVRTSVVHVRHFDDGELSVDRSSGS